LLLNDRIRQAIAFAQRHAKQVAVLFLDLDGFKHINDSLGHPIGDKLLQSVAQRLVDCVRASDTVSRQGGDEFVVLLSEVEQAEDAAITARRMLQAISEPHSIDHHDLHVTTSIGVSICPDDGSDPETLIKNADTAMYQAKESGRQTFKFFRPAMNVRAVERQSIEEGLRRALEREELSLHYQPKIDLRTGAITGAEALLRWTHPTRGAVSPAQFIPVAEACGLIVPIGAWVLRQACAQARAWVDAGLPPMTLAVNVSAREFGDDNFPDGVFKILAETGLAPGALELELTETVLMKRAEAAAVVLQSLKERGVQVALDDFGTGYSSLSYLRRFPVDTLKIDQSFVRQISTGGADTTLVTAVIAMARGLKLRVVAEGVETLEELEFLRAQGCDEAQGYYFSRPVPAPQFARLLETGIPEAGFVARGRASAGSDQEKAEVRGVAARDGDVTPTNWPVQNVLQIGSTNDRRVFLSRELADHREIRLAFVAVSVSFAFFLAAAPFATKPLVEFPSFIPAYQAALVICDLITAVLLFSQFNFLRSRALFALASGYLFTAIIAFTHALTFPGVITPTGLLGAGPQTTAWLYMFWHAGFPIFVICYALLKDQRSAVGGADGLGSRSIGGAGIAILAGIATVLAIVCGVTLAATVGHDVLPALIVNGTFSTVMRFVVATCWMLSLLALALLWWRVPRSVLDLWLMVVMCAWLFDIALSAGLNDARFDLGWYAGRLYGLLAAGVLLIVLLIENGTHYARLVQLSEKLSIANTSLEQLSLQDGLTKLANRRFFDLYLGRQMAVARRQKRALSLVLCDVDAFKAFNDHYGHQAGDECLRQIAAALQTCCRRPADMAARYGGEEFAMVLPDTDLAGATLVAEAARDAVAKLTIGHEHSPAGPYVSISGGVAVSPGKMDMTTVQLITAADQSLFHAKHLGRNRMVCGQTEAA
jgi:diguanylate cyclase (GGDEF)-like protein